MRRKNLERIFFSLALFIWLFRSDRRCLVLKRTIILLLDSHFRTSLFHQSNEWSGWTRNNEVQRCWRGVTHSLIKSLEKICMRFFWFCCWFFTDYFLFCWSFLFFVVDFPDKVYVDFSSVLPLGHWYVQTICCVTFAWRRWRLCYLMIVDVLVDGLILIDIDNILILLYEKNWFTF